MCDRRDDEEDDAGREEAEQGEDPEEIRGVVERDDENGVDVRVGVGAEGAHGKVRPDDLQAVDDNELELAVEHLVASAVAQGEREVVEGRAAEGNSQQIPQDSRLHGSLLRNTRERGRGSDDAGGAGEGNGPRAGREAVRIPDI